jgi:hypothetical protein
MQILTRLRRPKRLLAATGIGGLILVLAGCGSPGSIGANSAGFSDGTPGDTANFSFVCSTINVPGVGNCRGHGSAIIDGVAFKTLTANGATFDGNGDQCTQAPCPQSAETDISGKGMYGSLPVTYSFKGTDFDPATNDIFRLTLDTNLQAGFNGLYPTFSCNGCVEVVMEPGKIPDSVYNG